MTSRCWPCSASIIWAYRRRLQLEIGDLNWVEVAQDLTEKVVSVEVTVVTTVVIVVLVLNKLSQLKLALLEK